MFGTSIGTVLTFPICGTIVDACGWEAAFYVIAAVTVVWFVFWCRFYVSPFRLKILRTLF
jgi:predicted MFS family arabinose efflux permease